MEVQEFIKGLEEVRGLAYISVRTSSTQKSIDVSGLGVEVVSANLSGTGKWEVRSNGVSRGYVDTLDDVLKIAKEAATAINNVDTRPKPSFVGSCFEPLMKYFGNNNQCCLRYNYKVSSDGTNDRIDATVHTYTNREGFEHDFSVWYQTNGSSGGISVNDLQVESFDDPSSFVWNTFVNHLYKWVGCANNGNYCNMVTARSICALAWAIRRLKSSMVVRLTGATLDLVPKNFRFESEFTGSVKVNIKTDYGDNMTLYANPSAGSIGVLWPGSKTPVYVPYAEWSGFLGAISRRQRNGTFRPNYLPGIRMESHFNYIFDRFPDWASQSIFTSESYSEVRLTDGFGPRITLHWVDSCRSYGICINGVMFVEGISVNLFAKLINTRANYGSPVQLRDVVMLICNILRGQDVAYTCAWVVNMLEGFIDKDTYKAFYDLQFNHDYVPPKAQELKEEVKAADPEEDDDDDEDLDDDEEDEEEEDDLDDDEEDESEDEEEDDDSDEDDEEDYEDDDEDDEDDEEGDEDDEDAPEEPKPVTLPPDFQMPPVYLKERETPKPAPQPAPRPQVYPKEEQRTEGPVVDANDVLALFKNALKKFTGQPIHRISIKGVGPTSANISWPGSPNPVKASLAARCTGDIKKPFDWQWRIFIHYQGRDLNSDWQSLQECVSDHNDFIGKNIR